MEFQNTLMETLGIETVELTKDKVVLSMPVSPTVHQPMGYLHGGASVVLAESAASIGSFLNVDPSEKQVFGIEINANHVRSMREGTLFATATPIHIGRMTMVWEIQMRNEQDQLISTSRCTIGVVDQSK
ncbi:hotdog fold thioesterase [Halalkalibacillus halophilus]|uniref:hotdog fold thioesterase n=1 Tax=Halalkalibacillus halophilus TaxID=392827 RepID=UPI0003FD67AB|nr:hotdog fold thioesterase [Halalkalibacillus halophilus]